MDTINISTTKSKAKVSKMIRDLPLMLSGKKNDIYGVRNAFWSGFAHSLYVSIFRAYLHKSRLSKDELGNSWPDITPETKAYRRAKKTPGRLGLLSSSQRKEWWKIYKKYKAIFLSKKNSQKQAKVLAAKKAWVEIKKQGGQTKIARYGNEKFPVLIDKGKLLASLTPGSFNGTQYRPRTRNQVFNITRYGLEMGTRVRYAQDHHQPKRQGFPQRRLWPVNMKPWLQNAMKAGVLAATRRMATKL